MFLYDDSWLGNMSGQVKPRVTRIGRVYTVHSSPVFSSWIWAGLSGYKNLATCVRSTLCLPNKELIFPVIEIMKPSISFRWWLGRTDCSGQEASWVCVDWEHSSPRFLFSNISYQSCCEWLWMIFWNIHIRSTVNICQLEIFKPISPSEFLD